MQTRIALPQRFELRHGCPENWILVENYFNEVIIRAARDNFSVQRKLFFIRHLAAEGFIPARYQRLTELEDSSEIGLRWMVDRSWVERHGSRFCKSHRFMSRLLLSAAVLWLLMTAALFLGTR